MHPVPIQTHGIYTIPIIDHETHHTKEKETTPTIAIEVIQIIEIIIIKTYIPYNRSNYQRSSDNFQNRSRNKSQNQNSSYNNRQRNYSQSLHRNNNRYPDSQHRYRSNIPKHQRQINEVQTTEESTSNPPGIDDTGNTELELNHINCESTDS